MLVKNIVVVRYELHLHLLMEKIQLTLTITLISSILHTDVASL